MSKIKTIFQTPWFSLVEGQFPKISAFGEKPYYWLDTSDGVVVLTLTPERKIVLIRQFRPPINQHTWELPAGNIDPGETPSVAATRELYEETGYRCQELKYLGLGGMNVSRTNMRLHCFLGLGAEFDSSFSNSEQIEIQTVEPSDFRELFLSGEFMQFTSMALFYLAEMKYGEKIL